MEKYASVVIVTLLLLCEIHLVSCTDPYDCGHCTCLPEMLAVNCYGPNVIEFPDLNFNEKTYVQFIQIVDTLIFCLPNVEAGDFKALKTVQILNNVFLSCMCIQRWREMLIPIPQTW